MSRVALCILLCLPFGVVECALAQTDVPPAKSDEEAIDSAEVSSLIRLLGSSKRLTRLEAEKKLAGFGPAVLDLLPSPDLIRSVAARQAVRRIRIQLEDEAAKLSLKPSRVTLRGSFAIAELAQKIEQQTGNALRIAKPNSSESAKVNVDWKQLTFWEAMRDLEMSGWLARFDANSGDLILSTGQASASSATKTERAFRFRSPPFQANPIDGGGLLLKNQVSIECEPRLRPLFLNYASDDLSLKAEGKTIAPFNAGAKIELPLGISGREAEVQSAFLLSGKTVKEKTSSASLSGKVSLLLAAAERPIEFSSLGKAAGVARRRGGVTVTVTSVRLGKNENGHTARVLIRVSYDLGTSAFESHQTWVFHNRVWLAQLRETSSGISPNSFETVFQNETGVGVEYIFEGLKQDPAGMKFVYLAPTQLIRVPLQIEFEELAVEPAKPSRETPR